MRILFKQPVDVDPSWRTFFAKLMLSEQIFPLIRGITTRSMYIGCDYRVDVKQVQVRYVCSSQQLVISYLSSTTKCETRLDRLSSDRQISCRSISIGKEVIIVDYGTKITSNKRGCQFCSIYNLRKITCHTRILHVFFIIIIRIIISRL